MERGVKALNEVQRDRLIRARGAKTGSTSILVPRLTTLSVLVFSALVASHLMCRGTSGRKPSALATIIVTPDTGASRLMEKLDKQRPMMEALLAKEREWNQRFDAASTSGEALPKVQQSAAEKARYDVLDAQADSCSTRLSGSITGLLALAGPGLSGKLATLHWASLESNAQLAIYINYESRVASGGMPNAQSAGADVANVAAQLAPRLFALYPHLEYIEVHEMAGTPSRWNVAEVKVARQTAEQSGATPAAYLPIVELNQALVRSGALR